MEKVFNNFNEVMSAISEGITVDAFVVPNPIWDFTEGEDNLYSERDFAIKANQFRLENELGVSYQHRLVELWLVSTDDRFPCDNIGDHSIVIDCQDKTWVNIRPVTTHWPIETFEGYREGDVIAVWVPCIVKQMSGTNSWLKKGFTFAIPMKVRLNQKTYRYRSFGSFQSVLARLTGDSSWTDDPELSDVGTGVNPIPGFLKMEDKRVVGKLLGIAGDWETDDLFQWGMFVHEHGRKTFWKVGADALDLSQWGDIRDGDRLVIDLPVTRYHGGEPVEHRQVWFDFRIEKPEQ